jgi:hypothetical protein
MRSGYGPLRRQEEIYMRAANLAVAAAILIMGLFVCSTRSYGEPEYAKKEKKQCTFCHFKVVGNKKEMAKNQNEAGKYYKDHNHSFDGYTGK